MKFIELCQIYEQISCISSTLNIKKIFLDFLKRTNENDFLHIINLTICNISMNIGASLINEIIKRLEISGDLDILLKNKEKCSISKYTIEDIYNSLLNIANQKGNSSKERKINIIGQIINDLSALETKYYIRILESNLRIGLKEDTIIMCLGLLNNYTSKDMKLLKTIYSQSNSYEIFLKDLKEDKKTLSEVVDFSPGIYIKVMLAKPITMNKLLEIKNEMTYEHKYDGERAAIHCKNGIINIFARSGDNSTERFPDVVNYLNNAGYTKKDFIIDTEIIPVNEKGNILPFQEISKRKKKNVKIEEITILVNVMIFDILYYDNKNIMQLPLRQRKEFLKYFPETSYIHHAKEYRPIKNTDLNSFILDKMNKAIDDNCEGLIVKDLNSIYEIGSRSSSWLKIKKDYLDGFLDTFDVIPIGADYGKGTRKGLYGSFLVAVYNKNNNTYESLCEIGTGFSDEQLKKFYDKLNIIETKQCPKNVITSYKSDVFFNTDYLIKGYFPVWEIKGADITISPIHKTCIGKITPIQSTEQTSTSSTQNGLSLRFARLIRERYDKKYTDISTNDFIFENYKNML